MTLLGVIHENQNTVQEKKQIVLNFTITFIFLDIYSSLT
jgi:hypothetical protein